MSKHKRKAPSQPPSPQRPSVIGNGPAVQGKDQPTALFVIGDAEYQWSQQKMLGLPVTLANQGKWRVKVITHAETVRDAARTHGLEVELMRVAQQGFSRQDSLAAVDQIIRNTFTLNIPGSTLPLWKVLAMDNFLGGLSLFNARPAAFDQIAADVMVVPLIGLEANTIGSCGFYTWAMMAARNKGIPLLGLEVVALGNKFTLGYSAFDHFAVKSLWSKEFLLRHTPAKAEQVSILHPLDGFFVHSAANYYLQGYLHEGESLRQKLQIQEGELTILMPHNVTFLWETRHILLALAKLDLPVAVVFQVHKDISRRSYSEAEMVREVYVREIPLLKRVTILDASGLNYSYVMQCADLVIATTACAMTEHATEMRWPTIICQSMGEHGRQTETTVWETQPEKLLAIIRNWLSAGIVGKKSFGKILEYARQQKISAANNSAPTKTVAALESNAAITANGVAA